MKRPLSVWVATAGLGIYALLLAYQATAVVVETGSIDPRGFVRVLVRFGFVMALVIGIAFRTKSVWTVSVVATGILSVLGLLAVPAALLVEQLPLDGVIVAGAAPIVASAAALLTSLVALLLPQSRAYLSASDNPA